jgi:NTP pyrophosphatase (non-canonical NTP hydrolase)
MSPNEYSNLALRSEADQREILARLVRLGPQAMRLDNGARGLAGDAGEVSSAVMRYIEYGQPLDRTNLIEEVGDCLWRLAQICAAADFTMEDAMQANLAKLSARYPEGYSDERAANRDTDQERRAVQSGIEEWGGLPLEPCRYCRMRGGVQFLRDDGPEGKTSPQIVRCTRCGRDWEASSSLA